MLHDNRTILMSSIHLWILGRYAVTLKKVWSTRILRMFSWTCSIYGITVTSTIIEVITLWSSWSGWKKHSSSFGLPLACSVISLKKVILIFLLIGFIVAPWVYAIHLAVIIKSYVYYVFVTHKKRGWIIKFCHHKKVSGA